MNVKNYQLPYPNQILTSPLIKSSLNPSSSIQFPVKHFEANNLTTSKRKSNVNRKKSEYKISLSSTYVFISIFQLKAFLRSKILIFSLSNFMTFVIISIFCSGKMPFKNHFPVFNTLCI